MYPASTDPDIVASWWMPPSSPNTTSEPSEIGARLLTLCSEPAVAQTASLASFGSASWEVLTGDRGTHESAPGRRIAHREPDRERHPLGGGRRCAPEDAERTPPIDEGAHVVDETAIFSVDRFAAALGDAIRKDGEP